MKKGILVLLCLTAACIITGCAANATGTTATAAPAATNTPMPAATMMTTMEPSAEPMTTIQPMNTGAAAMTPAQAGRMAEQISEAVERISEVDDAEVIIRDDRVLVAVEFNDQYSAGLDDRMKQLITEAVQKTDDGLTDIRITDDDTLYGQVKSLAQRMGEATGISELADDFGDLWDRITGM
ncbi:MAG: YhcN/YlaJ family sporulation lipoprotein [Clostridia bacterium]|nr:YhcN/YlaJ family sporulation lipoprotein [Clostridia bacterium]